jgi:hypothetical protein
MSYFAIPDGPTGARARKWIPLYRQAFKRWGRLPPKRTDQ